MLAEIWGEMVSVVRGEMAIQTNIYITNREQRNRHLINDLEIPEFYS